MSRAGSVVCIAILVTACMAIAPAAVAAQGRLGSRTTGIRAWGRTSVVSPARSRTLGPRSMTYPASAQPVGSPGRWTQPVPPFYPPIYPIPVVYVVEQVVETVAVPVATRSLVRASPTGAASLGCATVDVRIRGESWRFDVTLPALDARTPEALFAAITHELTAGRQVPLYTQDGPRVLLTAGPGVTGLVVEPCGSTP